MNIRNSLNVLMCLVITLVSIEATCHAEISATLRSDLIMAGASPRAIDLLNEKTQSYNYITKDKKGKIYSHKYRKNIVAIVDYTLPSDQPRFFVINMKRDTFRAYQVSHGVNSGGREAESFSNLAGSLQSSLGFILTGGVYSKKFGRARFLIGLSHSNSNLLSRGIVLHSAEYASRTFEARNGFFGRSFGCLAVPQKDIDSILDALGSEALILAYHDRLWDQAQSNPKSQALAGSAPPPGATKWETTENEKGDPTPHEKGDAPTSDYRSIYVKGTSAADDPCSSTQEPSASPQFDRLIEDGTTAIPLQDQSSNR